MPITHHSQLVCHQRASEFRRAIYEEIAKPRWRKDLSLRDDLRRSARSVPANIDEGYWRYHHRDFVRFIDIALGSLGESEEHLASARLADVIDGGVQATLVDKIVATRIPTLRLRGYLIRTSAPKEPQNNLKTLRVAPPSAPSTL